MKNRKQKKENRPFFSIFLLLSVVLFSLALAGAKLLFFKPVILHKLAFLEVPTETPTVYLPGPYEAAHIESLVLGAETINPSDIVLYVNSQRMKVGAIPLRENETLAKAAKMRADVILKYQNFSHEDPHEHIRLDTVLPLVRYPFRYASENIGMGGTSARGFVDGFMNSASHKANLLNPDLQETGVAVVTGAYKQYYVNITVQLFAIPATEEQYLGYRKEDIAQYKQLIADLNGQIALTQNRITRNIEDKEYYEGWQKILIRQRAILVTLSDTMQKKQPFVKNLITLMREYNDNWSAIPKI